jgi:hypothetical protein
VTNEALIRLGRAAITIARRQIEEVEACLAAGGDAQYSPAARWSKENQKAHMHGLWEGICALVETEAFYEDNDPECMEICRRFTRARNRMEALLQPLDTKIWISGARAAS